MTRRPLIVTSLATAAAFALLGAGCGGSPSAPGMATGGTTGTQATGLVSYASCMRTQGVLTFPGPTRGGGIPKQAVVSAFQAVGTRKADAASNACRHLLPPGGSLSGQASEPITVQDRRDYLEAAACMRSHGFSDFPDPTFQNNSVQVNIPSSINQNSSHFMSAATRCTKLIPAGLPDSHPNGS